MNVLEILIQDSGKYSDKPALVFKGQEVTFSQLRDQVFQLANSLAREGVRKGAKVAFYLPNCPEYVYSYLATFCLGATGVPLDFMLKKDELITCLSHSDSQILIAFPKHDVSLAEIKAAVPGLKSIILLAPTPEEFDGKILLSEILSKTGMDFDNISVDKSDPALIMYTSGTTGAPKGILLNYRHLQGSPEAMKHFVDLSDRDVKIAAIPFSHIGGFIYIQNCLLFGITLIIMDRFHPLEFLRLVEQYRVTCFHIVPPMYVALLTLKDIEKIDLSSLRWAVVFGAPSSPAMLERFHKYCPNAQLLNGWGMTETCPPNTVTPLGSKNIASVGKPAPHCRIKIIDGTGREVPTGDIGELLISGWIVMAGYYKDPQGTAAVLKDGWLHTGDLARFDQEGYLYIVGRIKEMIKVGGQIVYAPEVEAAFYKHPAIHEVAVIGIADRLRGEAVKAFVVLKPGQQVSADDLRYFAKEHLAHFKVPQEIEILSHLPKNRVGKIDKESLKTAGVGERE